MADQKEVIAGGPGDASAAPAPAQNQPTGTPALVKIVLNGQEFDVPAELGQTLRRERDRMAGEYGSREQQYRAEIARLQGTQQAADEPPSDEPSSPSPELLDINSDKYDPSRYHRENKEWVEHLTTSQVNAVEQRRLQEQQATAAEQARNTEWTKQVAGFYGKHPELKGDEDIVDSVWRKEFNRLKDMPVAEGFDELAKLSKDRIVRVAEKGKALRSPQLETSAGSRRPARKQAEEPEAEAPGGLGRAIRERQRRFKSPDFKRASA